MLEQLKTANKRIGVKQSKKAIAEKQARLVFIAKDAEKRVTQEILALCESLSVDVNSEFTLAELGRACEIDVSAAVVCILN